MGNLYGERKWIAVNGRVTYAGGKGDFIQNETAMGLDRFGNAQNQQIIVTGTGDRPVLTGDLSVTCFRSGRFSIRRTTLRLPNTRISGDNLFEQFSNANFSLPLWRSNIWGFG